MFVSCVGPHMCSQFAEVDEGFPTLFIGIGPLFTVSSLVPRRMNNKQTFSAHC
jgi:hypothetical protein